MKNKTSLKTYLIASGIAIASVLFIVWLRGIFEVETTKDIYHILCDAFFVTGVVYICLSLLVFTSNEGAFDMLIYGMSSFIDLFRNVSKKKYPTFYDYRVAKSEKKTNSWFLLVIGAVLLLIAVLMLYIYQQF